MTRPSYLLRPRLAELAAGHRVVAIEAGGGAGKTAFALELAAHHDLLPLHVTVPSDASGSRELVALAADVLRRAGLARAASVTADLDRIDALPEAWEAVDADVLLVVDELQRATPDMVADLVRLARGLPTPHRLVLVGRKIAEEFDEAAFVIRDEDLAFTLEETVDLAERTLPADQWSRETCLAVHAITQGWAAPTVAALTAAHAQPDHTIAARSVRQLVAEVLGGLHDEDRDVLGALAALPRLNDEVVEAWDATESLDRARARGVPLRHLGGGWFVIANPFAEALPVPDAVAPEALRRTARLYADAGEVLTAADLLRRHLGHADAAEVITQTPIDALLRVHGRELIDVVGRLDDVAVARHPDALLAASTIAFALARPELRRRIVDRLVAVTAEGPDAPLGVAEDLLERAWRQPDDTERAELAACAQELGATHGDDPRVAARLAEVHARLSMFSSGPTAAELIARAWTDAVECWEALGARTQAARASVWLGIAGLWQHGRFDEALDAASRALELAGGAPSVRLLALLYRGMFLVDVGRAVEADATFAEANGLAHALRADVRRGHIAWFRARLHSQRGDADATLAAVLEAEAADVTDAAGGAFFAADAATLLARVGLDDQAERRLEVALAYHAAGRTGDSEKVPLAAMDVACRRGDLDEALRWRAEMMELHAVEGRDRWRVDLLLASAAARSGDDRAAGWAVKAFEGAGELGCPDLPFVREPAVARELVALAAEHGSTTAAELLEAGYATIRVLGGFTIDLPGAPATPLSGREAQALKYLAVAGGRVQQESLIDALWPDDDGTKGRQRLRVVLSRLKAAIGDLVVRDGDVIALAPGVAVDAVRFDDLAQQALLEADLARAEAAVAGYAGPLLPDDPYEPWAITERERLAWRYLALLDRLSSAAAEDGDLERALSLLYVGIDAEPLVDDRYVAAARLLCEQSRHARALALLERGTAVIEAAGMTPSRDLTYLRDKLRA